MCGAATSLNFLIAGRGNFELRRYYIITSRSNNLSLKAVQGVGAAGITSLSQIIIADLVPLQERGTYNGLIAL